MCTNCNRRAQEYSNADHAKYSEPFRLEKKKVVDYKGNELLIMEAIRDSYRDIVGYIAIDNAGNTVRIAQHLITKVL